MFTPSSFLVIFLLSLGGNFHLMPFFSTSNTFLQNFFRSKKNSLELCLSKISLLCILHEGYTFWILFQSSSRSLSSLSLSSLLFTFETVSLNCPSCPGTLSQSSLAWFSLSGSCGYRPVPPGLVQQFNSWLSGIFVFSVSYYSSAFPSHFSVIPFLSLLPLQSLPLSPSSLFFVYFNCFSELSYAVFREIFTFHMFLLFALC